MNIIDKTDEEILGLAKPLWRDLVRYSNEGKYGEFSRNFASSLARAMDQVAAGHQFAHSELARNLSDEIDALGIIRRGGRLRHEGVGFDLEWVTVGQGQGPTGLFGAK